MATVRSKVVGLVLLVLLRAAPAAGSSSSVELHTYLFRGSADIRNNPERGFRHELHPDENGTLAQQQLDELREYNLTVAQTYWYLPSDAVLTNQTIDGVVKTLDTLRAVGVKALFRFAFVRRDPTTYIAPPSLPG